MLSMPCCAPFPLLSMLPCYMPPLLLCHLCHVCGHAWPVTIKELSI